MNKYRNKITMVDGYCFDSMKEAQRYKDLKLMEKGGKIEDLKLQPTFLLQEAFIHRRSGKKIQAIRYKADFSYYDVDKDEFIVEDCKGMKTEVYKIKRKMFLRLHQSELLLET